MPESAATMAWRLEVSPSAADDFELIFEHLFESYQSFGEPPGDAFEHAATRIRQIRREAERILAAPERGTRHDDVLLGCRSLAFGKATYWFIAAPEREVVTLLAVFFGGQDQRRRMLIRLLS